MTDAFISNESIQSEYQLQPGKTFEEEFSAASIESIIFYAIAFCVWLHEKIFDLHKQEITEYIGNMKPHSLQWYAVTGLAFQFGHTLPPDTDVYDNTGLTDEQVKASKVVNHIAVVEQERGVRIKVATDNGHDLGSLSDEQLTSFIAYMRRVKDAGVKIVNTTAVADSLKLELFIKYDPLVLNSEGRRIDGNGAAPVQDAVKNYLKNLPFNGKLELSDLVDELRKVDGVKAPYITAASARYGALPFTSFPGQAYTPDAGYLRIYDEINDLKIIFEADV